MMPGRRIGQLLGAWSGRSSEQAHPRSDQVRGAERLEIREGWPIGCKVTLRSDRMYEFLERLISIAIPRIRDFRGISPKSFDGRGNFAMGVTEQIIFPEIDYDKIDRVRGLDIAITTTAETDDEGRALLKKLGMPFREK